MAAPRVEGLHPLAGELRPAADYAEAKRNVGGGWGTFRLGKDGPPIPGSAAVATNGMNEVGVGALGPRERGAAGSLTRHPHRRAGPKAITRGPTTIHRATTRIVGIEPRLQCIRHSRNTSVCRLSGRSPLGRSRPEDSPAMVQ